MAGSNQPSVLHKKRVSSQYSVASGSWFTSMTGILWELSTLSLPRPYHRADEEVTYQGPQAGHKLPSF